MGFYCDASGTPFELLCTASSHTPWLVEVFIARWWLVNPSSSLKNAHNPRMSSALLCAGEIDAAYPVGSSTESVPIPILSDKSSGRHVSSGDNPAESYQSWCKSVQNFESHLWGEACFLKNISPQLEGPTEGRLSLDNRGIRKLKTSIRKIQSRDFSEGLIASSYEYPKCGKQMKLTKQPKLNEGYEWKCRPQPTVNPHECSRSVRALDLLEVI
ncbi:hypothetical protein HNY73_011344 [Argiope bruennichi]|uniref:Uncharacterized protein n=1 Tax=Argiope bruennichi TaxID=94029 RepID=A0A8T0F613_ARGBR|nr:hypothetical protein HNY73_011344 [Argiope bruennichi]